MGLPRGLLAGRGRLRTQALIGRNVFRRVLFCTVSWEEEAVLPADSGPDHFA